MFKSNEAEVKSHRIAHSVAKVVSVNNMQYLAQLISHVIVPWGRILQRIG